MATYKQQCRCGDVSGRCICHLLSGSFFIDDRELPGSYNDANLAPMIHYAQAGWWRIYDILGPEVIVLKQVGVKEICIGSAFTGRFWTTRYSLKRLV